MSRKSKRLVLVIFILVSVSLILASCQDKIDAAQPLDGYDTVSRTSYGYIPEETDAGDDCPHCGPLVHKNLYRYHRTKKSFPGEILGKDCVSWDLGEGVYISDKNICYFMDTADYCSYAAKSTVHICPVGEGRWKCTMEFVSYEIDWYKLIPEDTGSIYINGW